MEYSKTCGKCKIQKDLVAFARKGEKRQSYCMECTRINSRAHYVANKAKYLARNVKQKQAQRTWWREYKNPLVCSTCREAHVACLDFHHIDPKKKEGPVSLLVARGRSKKNILLEIEKCIILCSNCHRKLHWEERESI